MYQLFRKVYLLLNYAKNIPKCTFVPTSATLTMTQNKKKHSLKTADHAYFSKRPERKISETSGAIDT